MFEPGQILRHFNRKVAVGTAHIKSITNRLATNLGVRRKVDAMYRQSLSPQPVSNTGALLADGLWDNPNHFFRLSLYLAALDSPRTMKRIAIVRAHGSGPQRRTLKALGFTHFIEISDKPEERFEEEASKLLDNIHMHRELLELKLPGDLPAYIFFDAALKRARHPQPKLSDPCWKLSLAQALAAVSQMNDILSAEDVRHVVLSHPWGLPYGAIAWVAISRKIPTNHLTGYNEGIRIRRLDTPQAFETPVEHLSYENYRQLSLHTQLELANIGHLEFNRRTTGKSTDINSRYAFNEQSRQEAGQARKQWTKDDQRPVVLICSHVWFDFPHTFAMSNFTDFLDWMQLTISHIVNIKNVVWVLKPHPTEKWYGGFQLSQIAPHGLDHIITLPHDFDQATALAMCDALVTVHGTAGIEAGIVGCPVLCADHNYYSDWPFVTTARSRAEYTELLQNICALPKASMETIEAAAACFAAALSQPNEKDQRLRLQCDSLTFQLNTKLFSSLLPDKKVILEETKKIRCWHDMQSGSYAVYTLLDSIR